jgi:predicted dehydrogenase
MSEQGNIRFGIIGAGRRAQTFMRVAAALPDRFQVGGVVARQEESREAIERIGIATYDDVAALTTAAAPVDFVIVCVPAEETLGWIRQLVGRNVAVLVETPPSDTMDGLLELHRLVERGAKIQVAEQYHLRPMHAARLNVCGSGLIGPVHYAQVSAGHAYHGVSLMRRLLAIGCEDAVISGVQLTAPMIAGPDRNGLPTSETYKNSVQQLATFHFGGKVGVIDFTHDQYYTWIRSARITVYGERGEIQNDEVAYMSDYVTPVRMTMTRHGENVYNKSDCLLGINAGQTWLYRNPFAPGRLTDDEIAIATCLQGMHRYVQTGEPVYSLAEAAQDQYLALMMNEAIRTGKPVATSPQPWSVTR